MARTDRLTIPHQFNVSDPAATAYDTSIWENADHNQKCAFIKDTIFGVCGHAFPLFTLRADSWRDVLGQGDVDQTKFTLLVVNSLRGSSGQQGIGCSLEQIIMITDSAPPLTVAHLVRASLRPATAALLTRATVRSWATRSA